MRSLLVSLGFAVALACSAAGGPAPDAAVPAWTSYQDCLDDIRQRGAMPPDWVVRSSPLSYPARKPAYDAAGHPVLDPQGQQVSTLVTLSGRIFFPPAWRLFDGSTLPLVVYPHATELKKDAVPSLFSGQEWMLGAAAAAWFGFAVAMPDLPGMGVDAGSYHPYCHAKSLAWAVADCLPAIRQVFAGDPYLTGHNYTWDGRLFLVGYSEGGYAALATVKALEAQPGADLASLTGSACMAGPFDLSGAMRGIFIDPVAAYPRSYYLPYFVRGYHAVYGPRLDPLDVLAPVLLATGTDGDILAWTDGTLDGEDVDLDLGRRLDSPPDAINLRRMFNPAWLAAELDDPAYATSDVHGILAENDLYAGWGPTKPILFRQSPDDDNIPYANTLITLDGLGQAILQTGGNPAQLLYTLPIGQPGDHISHTAGALIAIPSAFAWFYYGMPDLQTFVQHRW